jgi:uncharacterized protein
MRINNLNTSNKKFKTICQKYSVKKLSMFGSYAKNTNTQNSDIDLLVEFEEGVEVGYLNLVSLEDELTELFKRKVDLHTSSEISKYFRGDVVKESIVQYASK